MSLSWSCRLSLLLIKFTVIYSIFLGVLPYQCSAARNKVEISKPLLAYSMLFQLLLLGAIISMIRGVDVNTEVLLTSGSEVNEVTQYIMIASSIVLVIVVLVKHWTGHKKLVEIFDEAYAVQRNYFDNKSIEEDKFLDYYIIIRSLIVFAQTGSNFYSVFGLMEDMSLISFVSYFMGSILLGIILIIEVHFYFGVCFICRFLEHIKKDTLNIYQNMEAATELKSIWMQRSCDLADKIDVLAIVHHKLMLLSRRITDYYEWQILLSMLCLMSANLFASYSFLLFLQGKIVPINLKSVLVFPQIILINIVNFLVNLQICEHQLKLSKGILCNLKLLSEFQHIEVRLSKSIDAMTLQCISEMKPIKVCGLFNLNHKTFYVACNTMFLYLIVLIQIDFDNLHTMFSVQT